MCKKVISHNLQLLSKPSDQFLFVIIPLTSAFSKDVYSKELTVDRSKKAFMDCYFLVRTIKRQQKLSKAEMLSVFLVFALISLQFSQVNMSRL